MEDPALLTFGVVRGPWLSAKGFAANGDAVARFLKPRRKHCMDRGGRHAMAEGLGQLV